MVNNNKKLNKQIKALESLGVSFHNLPAMLELEDKKIFSINSATGEVNSYYRTLPDAVKMTFEAMDEDGFDPTELEIYISLIN